MLWGCLCKAALKKALPMAAVECKLLTSCPWPAIVVLRRLLFYIIYIMRNG